MAQRIVRATQIPLPPALCQQEREKDRQFMGKSEAVQTDLR
jgi:hypothetical protein